MKWVFFLFLYRLLTFNLINYFDDRYEKISVNVKKFTLQHQFWSNLLKKFAVIFRDPRCRSWAAPPPPFCHYMAVLWYEFSWSIWVLAGPILFGKAWQIVRVLDWKYDLVGPLIGYSHRVTMIEFLQGTLNGLIKCIDWMPLSYWLRGCEYLYTLQ